MFKRYYLIEKEKMLLWLACFILVLHAFSTGLQSTLFIYPKVVVPIVFAFSLYILAKRAEKRIAVMDLLILLMLSVVTFFNNANFAHHENEHIYYYTFTFFLFFIFASKSEDWIENIFKIFYFFGVFYALMTYLTFVSPSFFMKVVIPLFSKMGYADQMIDIYAKGYMTGFAPHYSLNAIYLAVTMIVPLTGIIAKESKSKKDLIVGVMIFGAILLTGKRAHSIFTVLAIVIAYLLINPSHDYKKWGKLIAALIFGVVALYVASRFIPQLLNVINRFIETSEAGDVELGRGDQRALALLLWSENPLLGIGWDAYKYIFLDMNGKLINVHCVYVQLLCEAGIIGALPFYAFFIISIGKCVYTTKFIANRNYIEGVVRRRMVLALYMQIFFLIYCYTGNPLYDESTLLPYMIACAISEYYWHKYVKTGVIEEKGGK